MKVVRVIRLSGGVILGLLSTGLILIGIGAIIPLIIVGEGPSNASGGIAYLLGIIVCIGVGVGLARLAVCCFSPKYANDTAERDYREIVRSSQK